MPGGQESDELAPQIRDLGVGETYVPGNECGADLQDGLVATEQGFSHENQGIMGHIAATGKKPEKCTFRMAAISSPTSSKIELRK
jgi:hypothetical protein